MRTLYIEFQGDWSIGLGSTFGDGHTDRQTHTHTYTYTYTNVFISYASVFTYLSLTPLTKIVPVCAWHINSPHGKILLSVWGQVLQALKVAKIIHS